MRANRIPMRLIAEALQKMHGGAVGWQGKAGTAANVKLFPPGMAVRALRNGNNFKIGQVKIVKNIMH